MSNIDKVLIKPDGFHAIWWMNEQEPYHYEERNIPDDERVARFLRHPTEIAEGVTLRHILEALDRNEFLKGFMAMYSHCYAIDEFIAEARDETQTPADDLKYLEIYYCFGLTQNFEETPKTYYRVDRGIDFHGVGDPWDGPEYEGSDIPLEERGNSYAIEMTPVGELDHLEVRLLNPVTFYRERRGKRRLRELHIEAVTHYSLLEVLDAILWEISFHGSPVLRNADSEELTRRYDAVKEGLAAGTLETKSLDDLADLVGKPAEEFRKEQLE